MANDNPVPIYMIGHSNLADDIVQKLLQQYHIQVVVDIRSSPFSKYRHQFNRETYEYTL